MLSNYTNSNLFLYPTLSSLIVLSAVIHTSRESSTLEEIAECRGASANYLSYKWEECFEKCAFTSYNHLEKDGQFRVHLSRVCLPAKELTLIVTSNTSLFQCTSPNRLPPLWHTFDKLHSKWVSESPLLILLNYSNFVKHLFFWNDELLTSLLERVIDGGPIE